MDQGSLLAAGTLGATALAAGVHLAGRRRRARRDAAALAERIDRRQHLARSLHPVIDPDVCIGSLSCLDACPEGDILGIIDHAARLVHADHCIGHGRCAAECPVGAIRLVLGSAERGVDLPEVDEWFESSRRGVHVVGELGGMGLIRNAVAQGLQAAERLAETTPSGGEVVVVGAGPAGLATALGLTARGVPNRVLEQDTVGGSIAHYPRRKLTLTEPLDLPIAGRIGRRQISKEELLDAWQRAIGKARLRIASGVKVGGIEGRDGRFTVLTSAGPVEAAKVVLATGRRGTPRRLGAPGEELPKVVHGLREPEAFDGARVLVVGGGDAAVEAAIQLATGSTAQVALAYRGPELSRCRAANRARFEELVAARRVAAHLSAEVRAITAAAVLLERAGRAVELPNDAVVLALGGELPVQFLASVGVAMHRFHGEAPGELARPAPAAPHPGLHPGPRRALPRRARAERRILVLLRLLYAVAGLALLGWLAAKGADYYRLPRAARLASPLHPLLKPAGPWGHGVGIAATAVMLGNFLYAARKRVRRLRALGSIRGWLDFHVFVGFMSPLVIAFHAAFQSNNGLATGTAAALGGVVVTGIVGRFIYGVVPADGGKGAELEDLAADFARIRAWAAPQLDLAGASAHALLDRATAPVKAGSLAAVFLRMPVEALALRLRILGLRRHLADRAGYRELRDALLRLGRLRWQLRFYRSLKRLLRGWRVFHAALAVFLVLAIAAHIAVSLFLGYGLR